MVDYSIVKQLMETVTVMVAADGAEEMPIGWKTLQLSAWDL
jgi:hypothetical protein